MAAPITYEGVLAPKEPLRNGLFKNMKFWVAHRIPQRLNIVQMIQDNGGQVVSIEKNANYLIYDHARNDAPPGSYSWKFIDESVKAGTLLNIEDYLCKPPTHQPRPIGSTAPQKGTRTGFTNEDDMIIWKWVSQMERNGERIDGNKVYKELEAKYPRHTWQSWRDRWVKRLKFSSRPNIPDEDLSPPPARKTPEPFARPSASLAKTPKPVGALRASAEIPQSPKGRAKYTEEDDEILIHHMRECISHGKFASGVAIFRDLANDFPHHSEQSWRSRWLKQLAPKLGDKIAQWGSGEMSDELPEEIPELQLEPPTRRNQEPAKAFERQGTPQAKKITNASSTKRRVDEGHTPHKSHPTDKIPSRDVAEVEEASDAEDQDDSQQFQLPSQVQREPSAEIHEPVGASTNHIQSSPGSITMEQQFMIDYKLFVDSENIPFCPWSTIKGLTFSIWNLWQAVTSQNAEPDERDWQQIAEQLGFDWVKHETVHDELREYYERYLAPFEECQYAFENLGDSDDEDDQAEDSGEPLPSSPPAMPSLKRSFATHSLSSDHAYPQSSPKRRRIERDGEVPSTPDHVNGTSHLRRQAGADTTPSARRPAEVITDDEAEGESRDTVHDLPTVPRRGKKVVEPETQDFRFDPETQDIVFETQEDLEVESQCNITPSQQLHQESDAISPDIEDVSSTPKASAQNPKPSTPTPRRFYRAPFVQDTDDEEEPVPVATSHNSNTPASPAILKKAKRRSLPKSFAQNPPPATGPSSSAPAPTKPRVRSPPTEPPQPARRSPPAEETPEDVIDRFCSLGYPRKIVLLALRATTWRLGDAGVVMEMLKQGQELPQRTHGVWTQRDDAALALVDSKEPPRDEREERKRARAKKRLEEKHGPELMELRRTYLWGVV